MPGTKRDYYDVLGVPRDAPLDEIKKAYRKLALEFHPDRNKTKGAEDRFKEITEAYAVLSDPEKRREYDSIGQQGFGQRFTEEDIFRGFDTSEVFEMFGGRGGLGDWFESIFAGAAAGPQRRAGHRGFGGRGLGRGRDLTLRAAIDLETVIAGGEISVRVPKVVACPTCNGAGTRDGKSPGPCSVCNGSGFRETTNRRGGGRVSARVPCDHCGGTGIEPAPPCPTCGGTGRVTTESTVSVKIPVGVEDGQILRVAGRGEPSPDGSRPPGDLLIEISIRPHPRFERVNGDLIVDVNLPMVDLALGSEVTVPTLGKPVKLKVPEGTQPGTLLRLRGKGLPRIDSRRSGDLLARIHAQIPDHLTPKERALLEEFRRLRASEGSSSA